MSFLVKKKKFYITFISLTLAIALQNVIVYLVNITDSVMVGRYSEDALSGVALVNQIQYLLQMSVTGIVEGSLIFSARAWGEGRIGGVKSMAAISSKVAVAVSMVLFTICFIMPHGVLSLLSNSEDIIAEGMAYLKIMVFTYPIFAFTQAMLSMLRSVETVLIGFASSSFALITNLILNYIMIYGKLGCPAMGVRGAAYATLIARALELSVVCVYVFGIDKKIKLKLKELIPFDKALFKTYFKTGAPVFFSGVLWGFAQMLQTAILGHTTKEAIAANSIASTVFSVITVVTYASATATAVMIGKTIGERKILRLPLYSRTFQLLFMGIGVVTSALIFFLRGPINALYNVSPEASHLSNQFMLVLTVTVIGTAYQNAVHTGIVRSGGDTAFVFKVDTIFMWCVVLPLSFLSAFVFKWPHVVTFICLKCDQIFKCFIAFWKVNYGKWMKKIDK
ncbi:MAG: MATE family efflux transporter [Ruminococcaceae bacterium]|nr:MATE family efflux transporter [Oscillospiraceae bacterium]